MSGSTSANTASEGSSSTHQHGDGVNANGMRQTIDSHLAQAYADLPDLGDIKMCIDSAFEETQYMTNICFVVKEELENLWLRICGMQASLDELAYMFAFLALSAHSSLQRTSRPVQDVVSMTSIMSPRSCKRHTAIAARLLRISASTSLPGAEKQRKRKRKAESGLPSNKQSLSPLQLIVHQPYAWRDLSECPPHLLRCYTHYILAAYHWHAYDFAEAYDVCSNGLVSSFRQCRLAELVQAADREGIGLDPSAELTDDEWEAPSLRYVAGLRRLHFEITNMVCVSSFPTMGPVCLDASELCQDQGSSHRYGAVELRLSPECCQNQQDMRMKLAQIRSTAVSLLLETEKMDFEHLARIEAQQDRHIQERPLEESSEKEDALRRLARRHRSEAFSQLDKRVQHLNMSKLRPYEQWTDERHAWQTEIPSDKEQTASSSCSLYLRFFQNRIRFELLARLIGSGAYVPALQAAAMGCALNTLQLLGKALLLLRSPWKVTGWLRWLEDETNAAISLFNKTIMHQVASDVRDRQRIKSSRKRPSEQDASEREVSSKPESTSRSKPVRGSSSVTSSSVPFDDTVGDLAAILLAVQSNDSTSDYDSSDSASSSSSSKGRLEEKRALEAHYPEQTGVLFYQFIFSFNNIFKTLQDLHIIPSAAFEAAKILKRLQVPHSPRLVAVAEDEPEEVSSKAVQIL